MPAGGLPFTSLSRFNLIKNVQQDVARIQMNNGMVLLLLLLLLIVTAVNAFAKCDRRGGCGNTRAASGGVRQATNQLAQLCVAGNLIAIARVSASIFVIFAIVVFVVVVVITAVAALGSGCKVSPFLLL